MVIVIGARLAIPFIGHNLDSFNEKAKIAVIDIEEAELKKVARKVSAALEMIILEDASRAMGEFNRS